MRGKPEYDGVGVIYVDVDMWITLWKRCPDEHHTVEL
jgi:hypothetical protein